MNVRERGKRAAPRCKALTRAGRPCARAAAREGLCRQHASPDLYASVLTAEERESYERALAQDGLSGEVAVLRLHLLRLLERDDPARPGEIPRTVQALVRALRDSHGAATDPTAEIDAVVRAEGRRLLDETSSE